MVCIADKKGRVLTQDTSVPMLTQSTSVQVLTQSTTTDLGIETFEKSLDRQETAYLSVCYIFAHISRLVYSSRLV